MLARFAEVAEPAVGTGADATDVIGANLIRSGSLAALMNQRDKILPQAQNQLDDLAAATATAFSNTTVKSTAATSGTQAGLTVDLAGIQYGNPVSLSYVDNASGRTQKVMLVPVNGQGSLPLPQSVSADPNTRVVGFDLSAGMASAATQIQAALGTNFTVSNPAGNQLTILDDGTTYNRVDISSLSAYITQTSLQGGSTAMPLFTIGSNGPLYTGAYTTRPQKTGLAQMLAVNQGIVNDPSLLVKFSATTNDGDPTRPQALVDQLSNAQFSFGPETGIVQGSNSFTTTISDFANQMTSHWGQVQQDATTAQSSQNVIQNNLQQRFTATSAVSMDQELAQLVQIQSAYSANARVMTVAQAMLQTLMQIPT